MHAFDQKITARFVLRFTLPSMAMMVFNSFYTMVDGGFVSHFVGTGALSAINIVFPLLNFVFAVGVMLGAGGSAVVAKQMGEGQAEKSRRSFSLLVLCGALAGSVMGALGFLFADPLVRMLGANESIYGYCMTYARTLAPFVPFCILQVLFQFFFATGGKPHLGLWAIVAGGVANLVLDFLFVVPLQMGIFGAALATGIGFTIPSVMGLFYFSVHRGGHLYFTKPEFCPQTLAKACTNGSSEMVSNLALAVTTFLFNIIMMRFAGEDGVAAITIVFYAQYLFTAIFMGYSSGVAPLISYQYGADNRKRLHRLFTISLWFVGLCSVAACVLSFVLDTTVVRVFARPGTEVYAIAVRGMRLFACGFLFMGLNIFASGLFTALSNGRVSAMLSFLRTFVFLVVFIVGLSFVFGMDGLWLAIPAAEFAALLLSAAAVLRLRSRYGY